MDVKRLYQIGKTNGACQEARTWLSSQDGDVKTLPITTYEIRWLRWLTYKLSECPSDLYQAVDDFYTYIYAVRDKVYLDHTEELDALEYSDDTAYWNRIDEINRQWVVDMQPEVDQWVEKHKDAFVAWLERVSK